MPTPLITRSPPSPHLNNTKTPPPDAAPPATTPSDPDPSYTLVEYGKKRLNKPQNPFTAPSSKANVTTTISTAALPPSNVSSDTLEEEVTSSGCAPVKSHAAKLSASRDPSTQRVTPTLNGKDEAQQPSLSLTNFSSPSSSPARHSTPWSDTQDIVKVSFHRCTSHPWSWKKKRKKQQPRTTRS